MSSIIKGITDEQHITKKEPEVHVPGYGTMPLDMLKRHVQELSKDFNTLIQQGAFLKAAYRSEQFYNALMALAKALPKPDKVDETHSTGTTVGSAGIGGGAGLGIDKSPIEKVIEKPLGEGSKDKKNEDYSYNFPAVKADAVGGAGLGEKINTPGGMGQAYRKFRPKSAGLDEEQAPMFTPEEKMVNANDPMSDGWRLYKTKESSIMKGLQAEGNVNEYELDSSRKIEFSKENPPSFDYLYREFIHNMLSSTNKSNPQDWINAVNKHYGLSYTYKDYQNFGKNRDMIGGWDKFVKKHILGK